MSTSPADTRRRQLLATLAALPAGAAPWGGAQAALDEDGGRKVLRLLFSAAETRFDPARVSDIYSRCVMAHIFDALYTFDHLASDARLRPVAADGMPEVSADFRTWTIRVKKGIWYQDDPAFKGQRRELLARDFVYATQRIIDPANISPVLADVMDLGIVGLREARDAATQAIKAGGRFDYDRPIEGLQVLDSHTLRIRLESPRPRLLQWFADASLTGGVAREVVEFYGDTIGEHPVGTGPFRLKRWRRSSQIVLERSPSYREVPYDGAPAADDAEGQALLARFKGRRLPMIDEVQVSIIEESQPQWLTFLNAQVDGLAGVTGQLQEDFVTAAAPGGQLAPNLARRGVQMRRTLAADMAYVFFNMRDPVVGGMQPAQVALRRAISLAYDVHEEIRQIRRNQAVAGQTVLMPHVVGYDPAFKSEMSDHDPARANALLDLYGFADRDGDGWRERPDGSPLLIEMATEPEQRYRAYNELWQKSMKAVGLRMRFKTQQWPENLKSAEAGKLQMWMLGGSAANPDPVGNFTQLYGPQAGNGNLARFQLDEFDRLYERLLVLPDGPERMALVQRAKRIAVAYMPVKVLAHRIRIDLLHPWVQGFRRPVFALEWWHTVDLDTALRQRALAS